MNHGRPLEEVFASMLFQNHLANLARQHQRDEDEARIIELDDLPGASGSQKSFSRKVTSFEKHMQLEEQSSTYMKQGKYFEAYGLLKTQHELGPKVHFASVLIKYYVSLMKTDRLENAEKIRHELCALLEEKFSDSCEEVCEYAHHLRQQRKFMEAVLFYQVSLHLCEKEKHLPTVTILSQKISGGLANSGLMLLEESLVNKQTIRSYFIPLLQKIRLLVKESITLDMKLSSLVQAICWRNIERCQFLIGDLKRSEETLKEAISCIKRYHGRDGNQYSLFGDLLGHLGINYMMTDRPGEAIKMINQGIAALKKARDFDTPVEKSSSIAKLEELLQLAQRKV